MKVSRRILRLVVIGVAGLALAAPTAKARPVLDPLVAPSSGVVSSEPAPTVQSIDAGFDWASAAIGAGAAGAIILLISWGGRSYRHRHEHIGIAR
jgi:hypothetical protein